MVGDSSLVAVSWTSDFAPASSKEFLDIQAIIECGFTLKCVRDMIRTYNQLKLLTKPPKNGHVRIFRGLTQQENKDLDIT